jgi:hypothetical protein
LALSADLKKAQFSAALQDPYFLKKIKRIRIKEAATIMMNDRNNAGFLLNNK